VRPKTAQALVWPVPRSFPSRVPRKLERLEDNIGAVEVELRSDDLREIDTAASKITVQGDRLPKPVGPNESTRNYKFPCNDILPIFT
jgi:diketogulonate reductase-like aldo/keto reductase